MTADAKTPQNETPLTVEMILRALKGATIDIEDSNGGPGGISSYDAAVDYYRFQEALEKLVP